MDEALLTFDIKVEETKVTPIGGGLINDTWKVQCPHSTFVLQRINDNVFKNPNQIDENLRLIADYMCNYHNGYLFTAPHPNREGKTMVRTENKQYFRLFSYVEDSVCYSTVGDSKLAYEAARQFGLFTSKLAAFPIDHLNYTIPDFHNLPLRYESFTEALQWCQYPDRLILAAKAVEVVDKHKSLVDIYRTEVIGSDQFVKRVCHHDTKISNVLFNPQGHGMCVIDLDTVMPGYYISDIGDMFRTYLCADSEETVLDLDNCSDTQRIRLTYFSAIVSGYLSAMQPLLTETEKKYIIYAGKYMIYMQAVRFLADFLNGDMYYKVTHPLHNFDRAVNQLVLLEEYCRLEKEMQEIVDSASGNKD